MQSLGFEAKNATIYQMIADIDKDGSGAIDFDEVRHAVPPCRAACGTRLSLAHPRACLTHVASWHTHTLRRIRHVHTRSRPPPRWPARRPVF